MSNKVKKMAVLQQLEVEITPISLKQLLEKLGDSYSERSTRRWLADMVNNGLIKKYGHKRGTKYQIKTPAKESNFQPELILERCFSQVSLKVLEKIQRPISKRIPVAYNNNWLASYQPNQSFYIPVDLRSEFYRIGKRSQNEEPAGTYAHKIFNRLLIDLSYNSSRLEGNTYSLLDTERLILQGTSIEGKLDEEKVMILNHKEAIRYLVDKTPNLLLSKQMICTLHYLLADGLVETRYAGKIRDYGVRIGGSTYIPFENQEQLNIILEHIIQKALLIHDPYEQSLFLLIHLAYLQAFIDVNKRTARLSANIPLIKNNLVPLSFNDIDRHDYTNAMIAIYEFQDIRPLLDLYKFSYTRTCLMYDVTIKAMGFDEIRVLYRQERRVLIRHIIVNQLVGKVMRDYIYSQKIKSIKENHRNEFFADVLEDLQEINESRIAGLGITNKQLQAWIKKKARDEN